MNKGKIILAVLVVGAGVYGIWYYLDRRKKQQAALDLNAQSVQAAAVSAKATMATDFCNPPIAGNGIDASLSRLAYQRAIAQQQWDAAGRGMDFEYFFSQFKKEMGCP